MTATTEHPPADPVEDEPIEELDGDDFDDPADTDAEQVSPTDRRERVVRVAASFIAIAAVALFAARAFGWGPFARAAAPTDPAAGVQVNVQLPQTVIDAIEAAHEPGRLTEFENRPTAQDPSACATLPAFTNEALYGLAAGDSIALCERVLENGANPCNLWIGVATTDKGAVFYLSSTGEPLPNQRSVPTKVAWCPPDPAPTTTTSPPPATTAVPTTAAEQQPGA